MHHILTHQIWSCESMNSTMFHDFGANGYTCVTVSPEPFPLWTWNLYNWTQQGLRFIKTCLSMVTFPSHLELCVLEINYVSWFWTH